MALIRCDDVARPYLTSLEEIKRARSTNLLSEVLGQLPEHHLTDGEGLEKLSVRVLSFTIVTTNSSTSGHILL